MNPIMKLVTTNAKERRKLYNMYPPFKLHTNVESDLVSAFIWDGKCEEYTMSFDMATPDTSLTLYGILLGNEDKSTVINVNVIHKAVNTRSRLVLRGILTDKSKVKFSGLTRIEHGAKGTDAWLECRLLLLSDQAKGQAIPSLEILENDIKAGHASTAGKISELEMFYLRSRGFSETMARKMIAEGFLESVANQMPEGLYSVFQAKYKDFKYD